MIKKYQPINDVNLRTTIEYDGKRISIRFSGGTYTSEGKVASFGSFSTSDSKLQQALESDSSYGKSFTCVTPTAKGVNINPKGEKEGAAGEPEQVPGITNTQMAIEWLESNKGHKFSGTCKKDDVLAVANSLNVNFIDWK